MKQTNLTRWIEAAEARSICMLAGENPTRMTVAAALPHNQPIRTMRARLRERLCFGEAARRVVRFQRPQTAE